MTAPQGAQPQDGGAGTSTTPPAGPQDGQQQGGGSTPPAAPPWGSDEQFNPNRAWQLIQNLRTENAQTKADRDGFKTKVDEHERAGQSETERLTGDRDTYKTRAEGAEAKLLRLEIGLAKGLTPAQCARLVGTTEDELKADAAAFLAELPKGGGTPPSRRPSERLPSGGGDPEEPVDEDPRKVAARVGRRR